MYFYGILASPKTQKKNYAVYLGFASMKNLITFDLSLNHKQSIQ